MLSSSPEAVGNGRRGVGTVAGRSPPFSRRRAFAAGVSRLSERRVAGIGGAGCLVLALARAASRSA